MFSDLSLRTTFLMLVMLLSTLTYADDIYQIKRGDTLITIAKEKYGDGGMWPVIYSTNKKKLAAGKDNLKVGWTLKLPNLGSKQSLSNTAINKKMVTQQQKMMSNKTNAGPEKQAKILPPLPRSSAYKAAVRILFLGQLEGNLMPDHKGRGGILYVDAIANKFKTDNSLFLSVGDDIQGSLLANIFEGETVIKSYSMLGIDAMNVGNHEFDYNSQKDRLAELFKIANKEKEFTFLSANIKYNKKLFKPYKMYHKGTDFPIAVIGLIGLEETTKIHTLSISRMKLEIESPLEKAKKIIKQLKEKEKPKLIIVLSDMSTGEEENLAKSNLGIDFILGVSDKNGIKKEKTYGKTTILRLEQESGRKLGIIDVFKEKNSANAAYKFYQVTTNAYETIRLKTKTNPALSAYIEKKDAELNEMLDDKVSVANIPLIGEKYSVRTKETNLGNLIADALLTSSKETEKVVDAVFINAGSIQSDIPKGDITLRMLEKAIPYQNKAVILELTGEDIYDLFEHSVSRYEAQKGRFLQVSKNFQYQFSCNKKKKRIKKIKLKGKEINPARLYHIMVNDFIATGGNGFSMLKEKKSLSPFGNKQVIEIVIDYLKKEKYVSPKVENRILVDKKSCNKSICTEKDYQRLSKMKEKFEKIKEYKVANDRYKRILWEKFLNHHSSDIKCTDEDDQIKEYARQQKEM